MNKKQNYQTMMQLASYLLAIDHQSEKKRAQKDELEFKGREPICRNRPLAREKEPILESTMKGGYFLFFFFCSKSWGKREKREDKRKKKKKLSPFSRASLPLLRTEEKSSHLRMSENEEVPTDLYAPSHNKKLKKLKIN